MFEGLAEIRSQGYFLQDGEGEVSGRGRPRGVAEAADKLSLRCFWKGVLVPFNHLLLLDAHLCAPRVVGWRCGRGAVGTQNTGQLPSADNGREEILEEDLWG